MAVKKSKMEYFKDEIQDLILVKKISIKSAWKIINIELPEYAKISYPGFYNYVKQHIIS